MFQWILKKKIRKLLLCRSDRIFRNLDALQSFLIFFEAKACDEAMQTVARLKNSGKQVFACGYAGKKDVTEHLPNTCRILLPGTDYNHAGRPSAATIRELQSASYDVALDLSLKENLTIEYLLASLSVPLRIGLKKNDRPLYDLSINIRPESLKDCAMPVAYLSEQIIHYLRTIQSKE
jgi:hypothetical protein